MSVEASAWAWKQPVRGNKKLVLLALADWANDDWCAWPWVQSIQNRCGLSRSAVQANIAELEAAGYVRRELRPGQGGKNRSSYYWLTPGNRAAPGEQGTGSPAGEAGDALPAGRKEPSVEPPREQLGAGAPVSDDPVYLYWLGRRRQEPRPIPDGTARQLKRARNAGYTDEQLCRAIDGLLTGEWWKDQPRLHKLSTIFATRPGGKTFEDQVDSFIELGGTPRQRTAWAQDQIDSAKENLHKLYGNPQHAEQVQRDLAKLAKYGIELDGVHANGKPKFKETSR